MFCWQDTPIWIDCSLFGNWQNGFASPQLACIDGWLNLACQLSVSASGVCVSGKAMSSNYWMSSETLMPIQKKLRRHPERGLND
jgi:hypothetical protein